MNLRQKLTNAYDTLTWFPFREDPDGFSIFYLIMRATFGPFILVPLYIPYYVIFHPGKISFNRYLAVFAFTAMEELSRYQICRNSLNKPKIIVYYTVSFIAFENLSYIFNEIKFFGLREILLSRAPATFLHIFLSYFIS